MHKVLRALLITLVLMTIGVVGCIGPPAAEELVSCEVGLDGVHRIFTGKESVTVDVVFSIYNPSESVITLSELNYQLSNEDDWLGMSGIHNDVYIPGGGEVKVVSTFVISIASKIGRAMVGQGLPPAEATARIGALWKRMGEDTGTWYVEGTAIMRGPSGPMDPVLLSLQYSP